MKPEEPKMKWLQKTLTLKSRAEGCYLITDEVVQGISQQLKQISVGMCNLFLMHTSAGICLGENCDVTVRSDMKKVWNRLVPQGNGLYEHDYEGPDDMPAHVKSILSGVSLNVPICDGKLALGTWQGIWLMEYRTHSHSRKLVVTIQGS